MPNSRSHVPFNTHVVMKEDLDYRNAAFTAQIMQRAIEFSQREGVLKGPLNELEVYDDSGTLKVSAGIAYTNGERVQVDSPQTVALNEGDDLAVWIKYQQTADSDENAVRTGDDEVEYTVWYTDGYLIGTTDWATWYAEPPADELILARASMTSSVITITDKREYLTLGLPLPDEAVVTAWLADLAVTNAKIANLAVNAAKLAENAVTEVKLAAGTDEVPLIQDIQTEPALGDSVDPATKVVYYCDQGGGYEYKIFGRVLRMLGTAKGPVRRIRLVADIEAAGVGDIDIWLVAWLNGTEPGSYDPDDPGYDGLKAHNGDTGPETYTVKLELDVSGLGTTDDRIAYGVVMRNSTNGTLLMYKVTLVAIR